jgi:uncharacterized protein (TIGR03435 family)
MFCIAILAVSAAYAQPRFEVASMKQSPPDAGFSSMNGGPLPAGAFNQGNRDPGRITWTNVWLKRMIQVAYDTPLDRISGPDMLDTAKYDVGATIPAGTSVPDFRLMVQNLLAERLHLVVRRDTKDVSGYALEVAKSGLKIKDSLTDSKPAKHEDPAALSKAVNALVIVDESGYPAPRPGNPYYGPGDSFEMTIAVNGRNRATVLNHRMASIASFLANVAGMPVEDRTSLTGTYDFHLEYVPSSPNPTAVALEPGSDLFAAVQLQLGLRLVAKKVPLETLVVDRVEKVPTGN